MVNETFARLSFFGRSLTKRQSPGESVGIPVRTRQQVFFLDK